MWGFFFVLRRRCGLPVIQDRMLLGSLGGTEEDQAPVFLNQTGLPNELSYTAPG